MKDGVDSLSLQNVSDLWTLYLVHLRQTPTLIKRKYLLEESLLCCHCLFWLIVSCENSSGLDWLLVMTVRCGASPRLHVFKNLMKIPSLAIVRVGSWRPFPLIVFPSRRIHQWHCGSRNENGTWHTELLMNLGNGRSRPCPQLPGNSYQIGI